MPKKGKNLLISKSHMTMTKRDAYIANEIQFQHHSLTFFTKTSLIPATSFLSCSPIAYNTTASLDKPTCTDYVDLGADVNTDLDISLGPKTIPTTWM